MISKTLNNRYRLLSLLGEGGMASVYEAEDLLLGRKVAVKLLREQFAADPDFLARFQREARAAAGLSHPNIVAIYDVGSEGPTQYIVMELVRGRSIKEIVRQDGPLSAARAIDLGRQICEALQYAHDHGIVHRDVKSHNVLVSHDGRARIADFGIAVALGDSALTQSGLIVGTAHYLSPEQARGHAATPASDLYSVGVVLYEMVTGRPPFDGETPVTVALKQLQEPPVPPRRLNPRIPDSLQAVILKAMAKEPAARFRSGSEMAAALRGFAQASMEATISQPVPMPPGSARRSPGADLARELPRLSKKGSSRGLGPMVVILSLSLLVVVFISIAILAYSNGSLGRLLGGMVTSPTSSTAEPTALPVAQPTVAPTPAPTAAPTAVVLQAPQLVGKPFPQARQEALAGGLDLVIVGEANSPQPITYVISQQPAAGATVEKGTRIEVTVSMGPEIVSVPGVAGDTAPNAEGKLLAAGLRWRHSEVWSDQTPAGVVIAQNPPADARVEKGSEVTLTVSKGKEKVAVPNLIGRPEAEAQDAIVGAGLVKTWVNYQDYTTVPPGHVISQEPKAGTLVEKGTTIYIAVRRDAPTPAPTQPPQKKRDD